MFLVEGGRLEGFISRLPELGGNQCYVGAGGMPILIREWETQNAVAACIARTSAPVFFDR